jgi:biotin operon repressor
MYAASLEVSTVLHEGFGMSMDLMVQAMKIKVGNPLRKLVLLKLADNASDLGECWPSYQHIADQCEISKRSVMNHIEALCECGLIKKSFGQDQRGIPATCISSIYVVQEIHQG